MPNCWACGHLRSEWEKARDEAAKPKPLPPWCGNCAHPTDRHLDTERGVIRCPECNPLAMGAAS